MEYEYNYNVEFNGIVHDVEEFKRFAVYDLIFKDGTKICHFEIEYDFTEINDVNFLECEKLLPEDIFTQLEEFVWDHLKFEDVRQDARNVGEC